jgi:phosphocarrier protein HPr
MSTSAAVKKNVVIVNRRGLHARAAAKFCKLAVQFSSDIIVSRNDTNVPGRSLMGLLTLGASQGKDIDIVCTGNDAEKALDALSDLVERGFDEDDSDGS